MQHKVKLKELFTVKAKGECHKGWKIWWHGMQNKLQCCQAQRKKKKKNNTNATVKHSWRADHLLTNIEKQCIFICIAQSAKDVTISSR